MNIRFLTTLAVAASVAVTGFAENEGHGNGSMSDKPTGFRFMNNRLTIKPYVALSYTYDSNIDTSRHATGDGFFSVNPGADFAWRGDRWELAGSLWYTYNAYCKYAKEMGENSYGEALSYRYSNVSEEGKGWNLLLGQRFQQTAQSDSITSGQGRGIWRDRQLFDFNGVLERRFNSRWHAAGTGQYNWIDYLNDTGKYAPLYGWSQYAFGVELGYVASSYTDLLIDGGYSHYTHKGGHSSYASYSNSSTSWTLQAGVGTHATEKISYRFLMGMSQLEYGGHGNTDSGWTYSLSMNWRITRQLQFTALGNSYYQPSERSLGQAVKVYALSGGFSYLTLADRMVLTADVAYRREQNVYSDRDLAHNNEYDEDLVSVRLGANYTVNRWMSVYGNIEWQENWCSSGSGFNYDRYRGTVGLRFHY